MIKRIPFTEWAPDVAEAGSENIKDCVSAWPSVNGYTYVPDQSQSAQIFSSGNHVKAFSAITQSGNAFLFVGTTSDIYKVSGLAGTFSAVNVTNGGTAGYSVSTVANGGYWDFAQYGDDVIAASLEEEMQTYSPGGAAFSVLSSATATPKAAAVTSARNFLIVGNVIDQVTGTAPSRVQWSAVGDPTDFVVSASTQSDYNDLVTGGSVMALFGGEYVVVFQERAVWRMTYVGTPAVWQFDQIVDGRGLVARGAAAKAGNSIFYLSQNGFEVIVNGSESVPIGAGKVDKYFRSEVDRDFMYAIRCAAEPLGRRIHWAYRDIGTSEDQVIVFDYELSKWGKYVYDPTGNFPDLFPVYPRGTSDPMLGSLPTVGSNGQYSYLGNSETLGTGGSRFEVKTGAIECDPSRRTMVKGVRVGVKEGAGNANLSFSIAVASSDGPDPTTFSGTSTTTTSGGVSDSRVSIRSSGRFHNIHVAHKTLTIKRYESDPTVSFVDLEFVPTHSRIR